MRVRNRAKAARTRVTVTGNFWEMTMLILIAETDLLN
jgi:hypothetical protein